MARAPKLSAHCCWVCSTCPFGEVKPDCGGQGWKRGGTKRGLVSVVGCAGVPGDSQEVVQAVPREAAGK